MTEKKYIRFINSDYKTLFYLPDGGRIRITYPDREPAERVCRFIDECHTEIGGYSNRGDGAVLWASILCRLR